MKLLILFVFCSLLFGNSISDHDDDAAHNILLTGSQQTFPPFFPSPDEPPPLFPTPPKQDWPPYFPSPETPYPPPEETYPPPHHHAPPPPPPPHHHAPPPPPPPPPPPHHPFVPPTPAPHLPAATLANLIVSEAKLKPEFDREVFNYTASVKSRVKKIRVTVILPKYEEKDEYTVTVNAIPVKSGIASPQLSIGKTGHSVVFKIFVAALEHEPSTYYLTVHRGKSKWEKFGAKFLLALAIILIVAVVGFLGYGCYVCIKSERVPKVWPFTYFSKDTTDDYSSLGSSPSSSRP